MYKNKIVINDKERNNFIGLKVAEVRKERGWSQKDLANELKNIGHDVHKNCIQKLESGERFATDLDIIAIIKVLNITANELLGLE